MSSVLQSLELSDEDEVLSEEVRVIEKGSVSRSGDRSRARGLGGDIRKETRGRGSRGDTSSKVPA